MSKINMMISSTNLGQVFQDFAATLQQFPILAQVTSTSPDYVPGYALEELSRLTFQSQSLATHIADLYTSKLNSSSSIVKRKILKTLTYLTLNGSKMFRIQLRKRDEFLIRMENLTIDQNVLTGKSLDQEIRTLAQNLRVTLFSNDLLQKDELKEEKIGLPEKAKLNGMGPSGARGKYEGFGNAVDVKEHATDKVLNLLGKTLSPTDGRNEALNAYLQSSTGDYKPVNVQATQSLHEVENRKKSSRPERAKVRKHIPGKAGGGWSSSNEEEEEIQENIAKISISSEEKETASNSISQPVADLTLDDELAIFLKDETKPDPRRLRNMITTSLNTPKHLDHLLDLAKKVDGKNVEFKTLLLLEFLFRTTKVSKEVLDQKCPKFLDSARQSSDARAQIKAEKLQIILSRL